MLLFPGSLSKWKKMGRFLQVGYLFLSPKANRPDLSFWFSLLGSDFKPPPEGDQFVFLWDTELAGFLFFEARPVETEGHVRCLHCERWGRPQFKWFPVVCTRVPCLLDRFPTQNMFFSPKSRCPSIYNTRFQASHFR